MGFLDKVRDTAQRITGRAEQRAGRASGSGRLRRKGRANRYKGGAKQVGEQAKDAVKGVRKTFRR